MRILFIDNHLVFGECLRTAIAESATVVLAKDVSQACHLIDTQPPFALVIFDLFAQNGNGLSFFEYLKSLPSPPPVLVLTGKGSSDSIEKSKQAGAKGLIYRPKHVEQVLEAIIEIIKNGNECWPSEDDIALTQSNGAEIIANKMGITPRQLEVLVSLEKGLSNKEIAQKLGITEATVKSHVTVLFQILAVKNRSASVYAARKFGLVE